MLTTALTAAALLIGGSVLAPDIAASRLGNEPGCEVDRLSGECKISIGVDPTKPQKNDGKKPVSQTGCFFKGKQLPCRTGDGFFDAASGCYLTETDKPSTMFWDGTPYKPGTKFYRCWHILDVVDGRPEGLERFESVIREPGEPVTMDPAEAARQVVETMNFVAPNLAVSPYVQSATREGIVNVPIWMWVTDPGVSTTGPQTKTATLGGVTITATGTVDRIEWAMGDGQIVTCRGAGTPFTRAHAAGKALKEIAASPTCGHKYSKTSRCVKGGSYQVSATTYWNVHWTGGGTQGDIPLDFTRSLPLRIIDLRPVLVDGDGPAASVNPPPRSCG